MINSNDKTRLSAARRVSRSVSQAGKWALRLTCLFALLLALSPNGFAYSNPKICGDNFGNWSTSSGPEFATPSANSYASIGYKEWPGGNFKIIANQNNNWEYFDNGDSGNKEISVNTALKLSKDGANMYVPGSYYHTYVVASIHVGDDKKPLELQCNVIKDSDIPYLIGNFDKAGVAPENYSGDWNSKIQMYKYNDNEYSYVISPTQDAELFLQFVLGGSNNDNIYAPWKGGNDDTNLTTDFANDDARSAARLEGAKSWVINLKKGKEYTIVVAKEWGGIPRIKYFEKTVWSSRKLPVYPNGVYTEDALKAYNDWPVYYLQSLVLNDNRITPEYQFQKVGTNKYELEFTYRNSVTEDDAWYTGERYIWVEKFDKSTYDSNSSTRLSIQSTNKLSTANTKFKEGRKYKAIFDGTNLTFEDLGVQMPFISMIGHEWKQRTQANTPSPYGNKNTGTGWQEAWVQYNAKGQMARDRDGNVMYNTMWPPKHNIDFYTSFKLSSGENISFTLETKQLVLSPGETHNGTYWKTNSESHFVKKGYAVGNLSSFKNNDGVEYSKGRAGVWLDNNTNYTLYKVDNMWINGDVKIWTGWGGVTGNDAKNTANWSWHSNWGHYAESTSATEINPESSIPLSNREGDVKFSEPTYFKSVYFFYDNTDPNGPGKSVFFTELAKGGAEIAAMNKADNQNKVDYTVGYYRPALTDIAALTGKTIKGVVIDCYSAGEDGEFMGNVYNNKSLNIAPTAFSGLFENGASTSVGAPVNNSSVSRAAYIIYEDSRQFPNGNYFYKMYVTVEGETEPIEVESNPFIIFNSKLTTTLNAYQLIQDLSDNNGNTFITFKANNGVPSTPVYKVVKNNDNITYSTINDFDVADYALETKYKFTDQVLLVGNIPSDADGVNGYILQENATDIADGQVSSNYKTVGVQSAYGDRFMKIEKFDNLQSKNYALKMNYLMNVNANGQLDPQNYESKAGTTRFALTVPSPVFEEGYVEVFYGSDDTSSTDNATSNDFYYEGKKGTYQLEQARYQNLREYIKVNIVNATEALSNLYKGKGYFDYFINGTQVDIDGSTGKSVNVSTKLPASLMNTNQTVTMTPNSTAPANIYNVWKPGTIQGVAITDDAPQPSANTDAKTDISIKNRALYYSYETDENDPPLYEKFNVQITFDVDKTQNNTVDNGEEGSDNLLHHDTETGRHDYYLVAIVEKDPSVDPNDWAIAKTAEGDDNYAEYVVQVEDLNSSTARGHSAGLTIPIFFDHGRYYEGQMEDLENVSNPYYKNLEVRISYLYPFMVTDEGSTLSLKPGMQRVSSNFKGEVLKSEAYTIQFDGEVATDVESIEGVLNSSVKAGVGFIDVMGNDVEIYNAQGVKVAAGEGRHDVNAGVYVVRVSGQTHKVIVR